MTLTAPWATPTPESPPASSTPRRNTGSDTSICTPPTWICTAPPPGLVLHVASPRSRRTSGPSPGTTVAWPWARRMHSSILSSTLKWIFPTSSVVTTPALRMASPLSAVCPSTSPPGDTTSITLPTGGRGSVSGVCRRIGRRCRRRRGIGSSRVLDQRRGNGVGASGRRGLGHGVVGVVVGLPTRGEGQGAGDDQGDAPHGSTASTILSSALLLLEMEITRITSRIFDARYSASLPMLGHVSRFDPAGSFGVGRMMALPASPRATPRWSATSP